MKKLFLLAAMLLGISVCANAQYKPTKRDLGNDCTTENGTLGTWKEVTVTDRTGDRNQGTTNWDANGNVSFGSEKSSKLEVGGSYGESRTRENSRDESITYEDIRCVEDKNAKLPQQTPIRW